MMTLAFIFIVGTFMGSFLNVLIERLTRGESIMGRSHCDSCKHTLSVRDLIPLLSFFFLGGKCRYCKVKLSYQYPLLESVTGLMFALSWIRFYPGPDLFSGEAFSGGQAVMAGLYLVLTGIFLVVFFTDLKYRIIPDEMQIAFLVVSLMLKIGQGTSITAFGYSLVEGVLVMVPILLLYLFTRGRGMGFGDVKLAFNIGFLMGVKGGLLALYFGFIIGAVVGILLLVTRQRKLKSKIAFGPFLIMGIWVIFTWKEPIYALIRNLYGF